MPDSPDEIVRRLQAQVDRERAQAIEIQLGDPGPYRLPLCTGQQGILVVDQNTLGIWLTTELDQRILVQLSAPAAVELSEMLSGALKVLLPGRS